VLDLEVEDINNIREDMIVLGMADKSCQIEKFKAIDKSFQGPGNIVQWNNILLE